MSARNGRNDVVWGLAGTVAVLALVLIALNGPAIRSLFIGTEFSAQFSEAGGLVSGDKVMVSGVQVGEVTSVDLDGAHVRVGFELHTDLASLGDQSTAAVVSQTALGKKALRLEPAGSGRLQPGEVIPLDRTTPSFDITDALDQLTTQSADIDVDQLHEALDDVAEVLRSAAPEVQPALEGLSRLSTTIASRDDRLTELLDHTAGVSSLLADRDRELQVLLTDGASLLARLNEQKKFIDDLFENATQMADQLDGLIEDNQAQIGPALEQINELLAMLRRNRDNIDHVLASAGPLVRELGEVVASFPGFNVYIPNLPPTNVVPFLPNLLLGEGAQ